MNEINLQPLVTGLAALGVPVKPAQLEQFRQFAALLLQWNERLNLTAVRTAEGVVSRHFLDSLSLIQLTGDLSGQRLIDVGTGPGFPGLPLKIIFPSLQLTLVESVAKKARFLEAAVAELGLSDVTVLVERAEAVGQMAAHREQYDWAVARAVAELRVLVEYLLPLCRLEGHMVAMKGAGAETELAAAGTALTTLGGGPAQVQAVDLPGLEGELVLVAIPKVAATPADYPRRPGRPTKKPL
ncbi:MAG: 16S rRNA (guanine(527)-N(7))-methyltransferase RsmG [Anaerolineales bacterium]|nr:16S rRNA (guanine(527)-N(7))-methyltransferase RsmG [Anaerolineales bacterium]